MEICVIKSPIGNLQLKAQDNCIVAIECTNKKLSSIDNPIFKLTKKEIDEYFKGKRKEFSFPYSITGTEFQKIVYKQLIKVPYGTTISYQQLAQRIQNPKASRAVGGAVHRNPLLILVPCHRVIGKDGSLVGFAGGLNKKRFLLNVENKNEE